MAQNSGPVLLDFTSNPFLAAKLQVTKGRFMFGFLMSCERPLKLDCTNSVNVRDEFKFQLGGTCVCRLEHHDTDLNCYHQATDTTSQGNPPQRWPLYKFACRLVSSN
jgi:hypothetical protein